MHDKLVTFVQLPNWILERWWRVAYLIPAPFVRDKFSEILAVAPDEKFNSFVTEQLKGLMDRGTPPPAEIAGPILNFADDLLAGREPTLRAGDYIALRTYMKRGAKGASA